MHSDSPVARYYRASRRAGARFTLWYGELWEKCISAARVRTMQRKLAGTEAQVVLRFEDLNICQTRDVFHVNVTFRHPADVTGAFNHVTLTYGCNRHHVAACKAYWQSLFEAEGDQ